MKGLKVMVGRVWRALAIPLCMTQLLPSPVGARSQGELPCGTYRYTYPYNTENLSEDHYILLDCSGEQLRGWYFGTSDDFDHAREGYLPGFFVVEMTDIAVAGDSIHFTLEVSEEEYFARPVPLRYRSSQEVPEEELEKWTHRVPVNRRQYRGLLNADSLVLAVGGRQRAFIRVVEGVSPGRRPTRRGGGDERTTYREACVRRIVLLALLSLACANEARAQNVWEVAEQAIRGRGGQRSRQVLWGGEHRCRTRVNPADDRSFLQHLGGDSIGFSRRLVPADRDRLIRVAAESEGASLPDVWHQGIEDCFEGKGSTVPVCADGKWVRLSGID